MPSMGCREAPAVGSEDIRSVAGGHIPAAVTQIVDDVVAFTFVEQLTDVHIEALAAPLADDVFGAFAEGGAEVAAVEFGGHLAAGGRQRGDVVEQPVLGVRRQVHQESFSAPRRRPARIETAVPQRRRPVVAQIDGDHPALGGRLGAQCRHRRRLELGDLRLVDLVDDGACRPGQPVRP